MARLLGPDFVALQVHDLVASRAFYVEQLNLVPAPNSPPGAVVFQTTPVPFAIRVPSVDLGATSRLGWGVALWFACDSADELYHKLNSDGVTIVQAPFDGPFGRTFMFADPDGYVITAHSAQ